MSQEREFATNDHTDRAGFLGMEVAAAIESCFILRIFTSPPWHQQSDPQLDVSDRLERQSHVLEWMILV